MKSFWPRKYREWDMMTNFIGLVITVVVFLVLVFSCSCLAQSDELHFGPAKEIRVVDTTFIMASSYLVLMTVFDIETTFSAIRDGAHEANPLMKPFSKNRAAMYGVQLGIDAIVIFAAYQIKGSKNKTFGKIWWVGPMVVGTGHGIAGGLNCRYAW